MQHSNDLLKLEFIVCAFIFVYSLYYIFTKLRLGLFVRNIITAKIRSAPQGYVQLAGQVKNFSQAGLIAPFSGRPCCWYHYSVTIKIGKNTHEVANNSSINLFTLRDDTGECVISTAIVNDILLTNSANKVQITQWLGNTINDNMDPLLKRIVTRYASTKAYITETILPEGQNIYVTGQFKTINKGETIFSQEYIEKIFKSKRIAKLTSRLNGNDVNAYLDETITQQNAQLMSLPDNTINIMIKDPSRPFIIADLDNKAESKRLILHGYLAIAGAILSGIGVIYLFFISR